MARRIEVRHAVAHAKGREPVRVASGALALSSESSAEPPSVVGEGGGGEKRVSTARATLSTYAGGSCHSSVRGAIVGGAITRVRAPASSARAHAAIGPITPPLKSGRGPGCELLALANSAALGPCIGAGGAGIDAVAGVGTSVEVLMFGAAAAEGSLMLPTAAEVKKMRITAPLSTSAVATRSRSVGPSWSASEMRGR